MRHIYLFATILLSISFVAAQVTEQRGAQSLTEGRSYFVAFPQVWAEATENPLNPAMMLFISSRQKARVRIQTPAVINQAARIDREYLIEPNKILQVPISTAYMNTQSESKEGYGILVTGNRPISVYTYQAYYSNGELARHLPTEAWGKSYRTMNFYQDQFGTPGSYKMRPSQILIVAKRDSTHVTYTPTVDTEGGAETSSVKKGTSQTIQLERGETFLIKAKLDPAKSKWFESDLSGTLITSDKNIGVISGHTKVAIMRYPGVLPPSGSFARDANIVRNNVHEAMLPSELAGTQFIVVPAMYTATRIVGQDSAEVGIDNDSGDVVRIVALHNNTIVWKVYVSGGLIPLDTISAGESYLDTVVTTTTVFQTSKPAMCGQYGKSYAKILSSAVYKGSDNVEGHPTVEHGQPMLQIVPPMDRYVSYGIFKSPEGMDDFFNIVFKTSEIGHINVDGISLSSAFGESALTIDGTVYSYIRTLIGPGDHVVESTDSTVRWSAWAYGSLDGLQQGRSYGSSIGIDLSVPCNDSIAISETTTCGHVTAQASVLSADTSCGSVFAVYAEDLYNSALVIDERFDSGDRTCTYNVNVVNPTKDAEATIRTTSRSGKFVERSYTYIADKTSWTPSALNFGTIPFNQPDTNEFIVDNLSNSRPLVVHNVSAKYFPGVYSFSPTSFVIPPGGSQKVQVVVQITEAREKLDTAVLSLDCFEQKTAEIRVRGEEPVIYVSDQTWSVSSCTQWISKNLMIQNGSDVDLVITGYDTTVLPYAAEFNHFKLETRLDEVLPLVIHAGQNYTFQVSYNAQGDSLMSHRVDVPFYSNADVVDSIAILIGNCSPVSSVSEEEVGSPTIVSPTPVILSQHQYVVVSASTVYTNLAVYDVAGREMYRMSVEGGKAQIPTTAFVGSGIYAVRLSNPKHETVVPVICFE